MRMRYLLVGAILLLPLQGCGNRAQSGSAAAEEDIVRKAVGLLQSGTATRLEILYLPKEVATRGSVDPPYLERACYYRIGIERLDQAPLGAELATTLVSANIRLRPSRSDLRWGLIFYDASNSRVLTIYLDKFGRKGLINGQTMVSNGQLDALLARRCSCLWD
jgi:hypothetical protein